MGSSKKKTDRAEDATMSDGIERELGSINTNLENINKKLDNLPCQHPDSEKTPQSRIAALETNQENIVSQMTWTKRIGVAIAVLLTSVAAWFVERGGDN
jgi:hypothetical protein